jgi:hypothetical protein
MPKRSSNRKKKRPADINRLAKSIVDEATSDEPAGDEEEPRGRAGGLVGGKARAKKLAAQRRSEIAKKAAEARWRNT